MMNGEARDRICDRASQTGFCLVLRGAALSPAGQSFSPEGSTGSLGVDENDAIPHSAKKLMICAATARGTSSGM
jgi:hypothetical protein